MDWRSDQNPRLNGYFKLFRNLRDGSRQSLVGDPVIFKVWLYLLSQARVFPDEAADLDPGEVLLKERFMSQYLQMPEVVVAHAVEALVARGSLSYVSKSKLELTNWFLYQKYVHRKKDTSGTDSGQIEGTSGT